MEDRRTVFRFCPSGTFVVLSTLMMALPASLTYARCSAVASVWFSHHTSPIPSQVNIQSNMHILPSSLRVLHTSAPSPDGDDRGREHGDRGSRTHKALQSRARTEFKDSLSVKLSQDPK